jgi:cysteine desulfurase
VIYLDYNATSPVSDEVASVVDRYMRSDYGNASSSHAVGRQARAAVEIARDQVRAACNSPSGDIWFTSGSTEAISWTIESISRLLTSRDEIVLSAVEHKAMLESAQSSSARHGLKIRLVEPSSDGVISADAVAQVVTRQTRAVVLMTANNETGVVQPVKAACQIAHDHGALFFTDATQSLGKMPLDITAIGCDFFCLSGHKFGAPKGIGVLGAVTAAARRALSALIVGGGQEGGLRGGTLNVPAIVGMGLAAELAHANLPANTSHYRDLIATLIDSLAEKRVTHVINGAGVPRLPNTANIWLPGVDSDALIARLSDVAISSGSACQSSLPSPSHVLLAMGQSEERARQTIRISIGGSTTRESVLLAAHKVAEESRALLLLQDAANMPTARSVGVSS